VAVLNGWKPGKALNNYVSGGQLGGDVFKNTTNVLPNAPGRVWYEADVGLNNTMARSKQPGSSLRDSFLFCQLFKSSWKDYR